MSIVDLYVIALAFLTLFSMGLGLTPRAILRSLARAPGTTAAALVVNFLVLPLVLLGLDAVLELPQPIFLGLLLCMAAPGGGTGSLLTYLARGDVAFSLGLLVLFTLLSFVLTPLWMAPFSPQSGASLIADAVPMVLRILAFILLPLGLGLAVARRLPPWVERWQPRLARVSLLMLLGLVAGLLVTKGHLLWTIGWPALAAAAITVGVGLLSGLLTGRGLRAAFSFTTAVRNVTLAMLLATTHYADELVLMAVLAYGLFMYGVGMPAALVVKRSQAAAGSRQSSVVSR